MASPRLLPGPGPASSRPLYVQAAPIRGVCASGSGMPKRPAIDSLSRQDMCDRGQPLRSLPSLASECARFGRHCAEGRIKHCFGLLRLRDTLAHRSRSATWRCRMEDDRAATWCSCLDGKLLSGCMPISVLRRGGRDVSDSEAGRAELKPCVFIHTNEKQVVGALVAAYALRRNACRPDSFGVRIIHTRDYPWLGARQGQSFIRDGAIRTWDMGDLQSFTPLRFLPPQLMDYVGRAAIIDPDVFAVADVGELLCRDMAGKAILCRMRDGPKGTHGYYASSVMLLDCSRLQHWRPREDFDSLFSFERDYMDWISLKLEPPQTIGALESVWNDFDRLTPQTKMLHNTRRITQPWKTGLAIDFTVAEIFQASAILQLRSPHSTPGRWTWEIDRPVPSPPRQGTGAVVFRFVAGVPRQRPSQRTPAAR